MIESKPWEWSKLNEEGQKKWKEPSIESYYLINRWKKQNKKEKNSKNFTIKKALILSMYFYFFKKM